jgi:hypothetical protein
MIGVTSGIGWYTQWQWPLPEIVRFERPQRPGHRTGLEMHLARDALDYERAMKVLSDRQS